MTFSPDTPLKIGTRGSPLALAQAHETRTRLMAAINLPETAFEIVVIKTSGDLIQNRPLSEVGGKGLFTKEIEEALLGGAIDIAVHSMKDMPVYFPDGLTIDCYLPREDVRDAFISRRYGGLSDLPSGTVVGTSSLRRKSQLIHRRPDLKVVEFRGNVQTRLRKLDDGVADATFLAMAGLNRLGMAEIANPVSEDDMLPAIAQGCIGIERRLEDQAVGEALALINDAAATTRLAAERALLKGLDGSCQTPIAGLAEFRDSGDLILRGEVLRPDGSECLTERAGGPAEHAAKLGEDMARRLRSRMGPNFF
jgi:hydroxymethylbilane synthase